MKGLLLSRQSTAGGWTSILGPALLILFFMASFASAQQNGPLQNLPVVPAPPPHSNKPKTASEIPAWARQSGAPSASANTLPPPAIPISQIIQKFAEHEEEFKRERDNFTYTQTFTVQTLDSNDQPDGEYTMTSEIVFDPDGHRYERVTYAPEPTLRRISLSEQDLNDLEHIQPFVLTTDKLPEYNITYVGHEQLDELGTYVFDVAPKKIEKHHRYFKGRIWVEDKDMEIVKTDGKAVPDIHKRGEENLFPRFQTFRSNIEGHYWFPTYTRADDVLHFSSGDVHIRMTVRYANYKRFGVTVKIGKPEQANPPAK